MNAVLKPAETFVGHEPADSYYRRRLDEASASGLKQMLRSPAHFRHWCEDPEADRDTPAMTFGRAFHTAVLEPDVFAATYAVLPEGAPQRPTRAMLDAKGKRSPSSEERIAWWGQWDADNAGMIVLSAEDYDRAQRMADSVRAHPVAAGLLVGGERETTFRWQDQGTGLACKARADLYLRGEYLMDLKTCRDASAEGFARAVVSYGYDVQQGHYLDGIRSNGDEIRWFVFLACESEAPYVCQPHVLDVRGEERGFNMRQRAIRRQTECLQTGHWPGYSDELIETALPAWAFFGIEE